MALTFAEVTEAQIVELSASDIALVGGGGPYDWTRQDPDSPDYEWG